MEYADSHRITPPSREIPFGIRFLAWTTGTPSSLGNNIGNLLKELGTSANRIHVADVQGFPDIFRNLKVVSYVIMFEIRSLYVGEKSPYRMRGDIEMYPPPGRNACFLDQD